MRRLFAIVCLFAALSQAGVARAQNASEQAEARTLFNEGARLFVSGQYPEACAKLEASYHLYAGIGTRGKLAECYEKVGRTASAWAMYEEVAALAGKAADPTRERVARERAARLEPGLSHLTVVVPPGNDVPGLVIKRGGEPVERGAIGTSVAVDPGTQAFEITAPGRVSQTATVEVAAGQAATFSVPVLEAAPEAPAMASSAPTATVDASAPAEPPRGASWQRPVGLALAGAGVVTVVVGAVVALSAKSGYDSQFDSGACQRATLACSPAGQQETDAARSRANVGGVVLGVGAALAVAGGVVFFLPHGSKARTDPAPPRAALRLTPDVGPTTASLSLAGSF